MNTDIGALTTIFSEFYYWVTILADVPDPRRVLYVRGWRLAHTRT